MELSTAKISAGFRLRTMLIDHITMCFVGCAPFLIYRLSTPVEDLVGTTMSWLLIPGWAAYFCKDCINGRSPAKRMLKLAVTDYRTNATASPLQSLIRNIFIIIWPIEVIVALFDQQRRIGDRVAGTKLQYYKSSTKTSINIAALLLCFLIASVISYFLIWTLDKI